MLWETVCLPEGFQNLLPVVLQELWSLPGHVDHALRNDIREGASNQMLVSGVVMQLLREIRDEPQSLLGSPFRTRIGHVHQITSDSDSLVLERYHSTEIYWSQTIGLEDGDLMPVYLRTQ